MAGGAPMATFATREHHRTAVGYRYLTYKMPSFNFETCACAMWTLYLFTLLPLSNQSGGDNRILTSDRFGVVDANGTKGGVKGGPKGGANGTKGGVKTCNVAVYT